MRAQRIKALASDPTLMRNQPALRASSGAVWLIVGALFCAICLIPLVLIALSATDAAGVATGTGAIIVALYCAMVIVRLTVPEPRVRLRVMAACFLALAAVAVCGMLVCVALQRAPG